MKLFRSKNRTLQPMLLKRMKNALFTLFGLKVNCRIEHSNLDQTIFPSDAMQIGQRNRVVLLIGFDHELEAAISANLPNSLHIITSHEQSNLISIGNRHLPDLMVCNNDKSGITSWISINKKQDLSAIPLILFTQEDNKFSKSNFFDSAAVAYVKDVDTLVSGIIAQCGIRLPKNVGGMTTFTSNSTLLTSKDQKFLLEITTIINNSLSNSKFSVKELAKSYSISPRNMNQKIKSITGKTSIQFIRHLRLQRAADLLKVKHNRISDVTYDVGFTDLQYFRDNFKKEFQITPSEYKKKYCDE